MARKHVPDDLLRRAALRHAARTYVLAQAMRDGGATWAEVSYLMNFIGERTFEGRYWSPQRLCQIMQRGFAAHIDIIVERRFERSQVPSEV